MFEGFEGPGDRQSRKRFAASSGLSIGIGALLVLSLVALASRPREKRAAPPPVEVTFHAPVKAKPPPPPPPAPRPKRAAVRAAHKAAGPSAAPTQRPTGALPEADASGFQGGALAGIAWGEEAMNGLGGDGGADRRRARPVAAAAPRGPAARPVEEAERASQPRPQADNPLPSYPDAMRRKGVEALVILRVLIDEDGRVADIQVVQGDQPFVAAATDVVRSWRYQPGTLDGRPAAMHRLIRVPFRLRA
ncbi:MAG TPA: energy transducer TonB [Kofleriaceae bacterium]|nr:energy transducer TonB [Kofleriaceae bacterium]